MRISPEAKHLQHIKTFDLLCGILHELEGTDKLKQFAKDLTPSLNVIQPLSVLKPVKASRALHPLTPLSILHVGCVLQDGQPTREEEAVKRCAAQLASLIDRATVRDSRNESSHVAEQIPDCSMLAWVPRAFTCAASRPL